MVIAETLGLMQKQDQTNYKIETKSKSTIQIACKMNNGEKIISQLPIYELSFC